MKSPERISARDNPLLVRLRRSARDPAAYRRDAQVWLEGEHLCRALVENDRQPAIALIAESAWACAQPRALASHAARVVIVADAMFAAISALPSPAAIGFVWPLPPAPAIDPDTASVVLDRIQDAGNVGSILRSAAAFGAGQVLALAGTAALWSPKVLRAAMGAHFALRLVEGLERSALDALRVPLIGTQANAPTALHRCRLPHPCAWVFGHEGQGMAGELRSRCSCVVAIEQPGGQESLNVAAAAAVCLYESSRQRLQ